MLKQVEELLTSLSKVVEAARFPQDEGVSAILKLVHSVILNLTVPALSEVKLVHMLVGHSSPSRNILGMIKSVSIPSNVMFAPEFKPGAVLDSTVTELLPILISLLRLVPEPLTVSKNLISPNVESLMLMVLLFKE